MIAKIDETAAMGLIEGYKREVQLYRSMLELTQKQADCLSRRVDMGEFMGLLQKKEDLIRDIDKVETSLMPLKRAWQEMPEDEKKELGGKTVKLNRLLDEVIILIEKIIRSERENEKVLQTKRSQLGDEIALIDRGRRVHKAFTPDSEPRFVDART